MMRQLVVSSIVLAAATSNVFAGALVPKKASETVVLTSSPFSGPCTVEQIGTQIIADGTEAAFALETGKVLMVTDITWMLEDGTAGDTVGIEFSLDGGDVATMTVDGEVNARGIARGQTHFSTPVRIGDVLCANPVVMEGTTVPQLHDVRVMGFLAGDR
jgi:hypothetical protein